MTAAPQPSEQDPPISITWVGHSTLLISMDGFTILTDPALTFRLAHLRRRVAVPTIEAADVVLISHVHMDHLHGPSLRTTAAGCRLVAPHGSAPLLRSLDAASFDDVRPGDRRALRERVGGAPAVAVDVVHANHKCGRGPHSRIKAPPVGYVLHIGERTIYFAGDTDLFDDMHHLGRIDAALLPIWGWGPSIGVGHLDPSRAATAVEWLDPRVVVPIHWGTYSPVRARRGSPPWLNRPIDEFRVALGARGLEDRLVAMDPGGSVTLEDAGP